MYQPLPFYQDLGWYTKLSTDPNTSIKEDTRPFSIMYLLLNLLYYNSLADFIIISSDITLSNGISFNKALESLKGL